MSDCSLPPHRNAEECQVKLPALPDAPARLTSLHPLRQPSGQKMPVNNDEFTPPIAES